MIYEITTGLSQWRASQRRNGLVQYCTRGKGEVSVDAGSLRMKLLPHYFQKNVTGVVTQG
jgi:hypothetical protein